MKPSPVSLALAAFAIAILDRPLTAADNAVVGTWRITNYSNVTLGTNKVSRPFGDNLIGYIQYSPGGHMVVFLQRGDTEQPHNAIFDDSYRAQVHRETFGAYAGTYSLDGNMSRIISSLRGDMIGSVETKWGISRSVETS
jgi:hypothetical protein